MDQSDRYCRLFAVYLCFERFSWLTTVFQRYGRLDVYVIVISVWVQTLNFYKAFVSEYSHICVRVLFLHCGPRLKGCLVLTVRDLSYEPMFSVILDVRTDGGNSAELQCSESC